MRMMGTPGFMAPEQVNPKHGVDHRADIFSLGCVLYLCLTGTLPYPAGNAHCSPDPLGVRAAWLHRGPTGARDVLPRARLPSGARGAAVRRDPEARSPDAAAKFERLRDDTMVEVIRTFPSKVITSKDFGDEGEELFLRIRDQVNKAGRGRISIAISDPDAVIYINEIVHRRRSAPEPPWGGEWIQ